MHMKPELDLLPVDFELERTLRSLRKVSKAEKATMADEELIRQLNKKQQQKGLQFKIQWRIFGCLSSKQNTQQSDNLL